MKKSMDRKGFTLVELLAVIVILVSVSLVAVGGISSSLGNRDEKEKKEQEELVISAAKMYFSMEDKTCVKISDLIGKYIKDDSKIDKLDTNKYVNLVSNKYVINTTVCS